MILRQRAVALLINRIVEADVGNRRNRHSHLIQAGVTKQSIERRRSAAAPSPNRDPVRIDERPLIDRAHGVSLILGIYYSLLPIENLAPGASARRRRAAIVNAHYDVAVLRQQPVPHEVSAAPLVQNSLRGGFAIDVKKNRVAFMRIEIRRLDHPAIKLHPVADIDAKELARALLQPGQPLAQFFVVDQRSHGGVLWQSNDIEDRRLIEI